MQLPRLRMPGETERRLAFAVLVAAIAPLAAAVVLASSLFKQASSLWFNPDVGQQLDRGVAVYKDYVKAIKDDMRHQTDAIAADEVLREAARHRNSELIEAQLDTLFPRFPELVVLRIADADGRQLAARDRGRPVDEQKERSLEVRRPLAEDPEAPQVVATFAVDRKRLDELEAGSAVVTSYHQLEAARGELYQGYLYAFAALLGFTALLTLVVGALLARGVTRRIDRLVAAIDLVAQGDLSVRVPVTGSDELTNLARTFNRMLSEMAQSRARIEFLQRMGAWQEMAQRLAHEIKNPLTPIQLAVQECHRKYAGDDARFRALLDTTLEIVEEEVGTLRRLVGHFSNFARLPHAQLRDESLREFLRECSEQLGHLEILELGDGLDDATSDGDDRGRRGGASEGDDAAAGANAPNVDVTWQVPDDPLEVAIDRQMLRRVVVNLVRNAVQAIRDARARDTDREGHVTVRAEPEGGGAALVVEDDGPGVPEDRRARIFEPYFTTKEDGTGLGLAIVKKIVVEHGGSIDVGVSEGLGGARFVVHLPGPKSVMLLAAAEARERAREVGVLERT